jgi:lipid-A-disaccharide synthase
MNGRPLRLFVVAGEPSADRLGGRLVAALQDLAPGPVELLGVGGPELRAAGLRPLFAMEELALMGLVEILPHLPRLWRRLGETERAVRAFRPDVVLTIDAPGFNLRLLERLRGAVGAKVHYVAPQAWAWRPGRARRLLGLVDRLLLLLPFEPAFFARYGIPCTLVGHPVIEQPDAAEPPAAFRARLGLADAAPLLCLMPGSRLGEVRRHLPMMREVVGRLAVPWPRLGAVLPTVSGLGQMVRTVTGAWPRPPVVLDQEADRRAAMAAADLALTASGTATLELALAGTPMVVMHRLHPLTGLLARRLLRVPHVSLVNLVLERDAVPELLQERCEPDAISVTLRRLLDQPAARGAQRRALAGLRGRLVGPGAAAPSRLAARAVLEAAAAGAARPGPVRASPRWPD